MWTLYNFFMLGGGLLKTNIYKNVLSKYPYMWSDTISSGPTDIGPPNTSHAQQTETPDIYEFRFFAFAKS